MKRSGMLKPTCCEIVPRDRVTFENIDFNLTSNPAIANSCCWVLGVFCRPSFVKESLSVVKVTIVQMCQSRWLRQGQTETSGRIGQRYLLSLFLFLFLFSSILSTKYTISLTILSKLKIATNTRITIMYPSPLLL